MSLILDVTLSPRGTSRMRESINQQARETFERSREACADASVLECESVHVFKWYLLDFYRSLQHWTTVTMISEQANLWLRTWQLNWQVETPCASTQTEAYGAIVGSFSINSKLMCKSQFLLFFLPEKDVLSFVSWMKA